MKAVFPIVACATLLAACTPMAELAYDLRLDYERENCNKAPDMATQRACIERSRAAEKEAQKARAGR
jgi:hypothetical protein